MEKIGKPTRAVNFIIYTTIKICKPQLLASKKFVDDVKKPFFPNVTSLLFPQKKNNDESICNVIRIGRSIKDVYLSNWLLVCVKRSCVSRIRFRVVCNK